MLNARYQDNTFSSLSAWINPARSAEGKNEVKRVVPTLRPVATILEGETGIYRGMLAAVVYPMPDGELVRLPFSDSDGYEYHKARYLPKDHPIVLAHQKNPYAEIEVDRSQKDIEGQLLNDRDKAWLKSTLDAQLERDRREARAQGLIP